MSQAVDTGESSLLVRLLFFDLGFSHSQNLFGSLFVTKNVPNPTPMVAALIMGSDQSSLAINRIETYPKAVDNIAKSGAET